MGTITDKLNWLYDRKKDIIDLINERKYSTNKTEQYGYLDSDFSALNADYMRNFTHRMRLVPVLTLYMQYNYIPSSNTYLSEKTTTRTQTWLNNIIGNDNNYSYDGNVPSITRTDVGVLLTTNNAVHSASVLNIPFIIGCGPTEHDTVESTWMVEPLYGCISYYYNPTTNHGGMKLLLGDDSTKNDGHFILGNISLIDPLTQGRDMFEYSMYCIGTFYFGLIYELPGTNVNYGVSVEFFSYTLTRIGAGNYSITFDIGNNDYSRFYVIPIQCLSTAGGAGGKTYITIKSISVSSNSIVVKILTAANGGLNDAPFGIMLFAQKYIS